MRLATFNAENMFERASIMNLPTWDDGRKGLQDFSRLTDLIQKQQYSEQDKDEMLSIMKRYKGLLTTGESTYIILNEIRGKLIKKGASPKIAVNGRDDWIGWFDLKQEPVNEVAIENTGRVFHELDADVFCVEETESRTALNHFNETVIPKVGGPIYGHVMLIDGNDDRGIDVGIMTKRSFEIQSIVSHVDDFDAHGKIFSRDCAEYKIRTSSGNMLLVLLNHFKSKGYGSPEDNNKKRERQAKRAREIYDQRLNEGHEFIAVVGDLNDTPSSSPLQPLVGNGSNIVDIMTHNKFVGDSRPGTHGNGNASDKIDYILMSPQLANVVQQGGIERRGVWGGKNGTLFPHFPEIKKAKDAASDHAALWVDLDL
jgi:endonuclease/exonuclease/phosphatase family metal-dependent hydrolase